MSANNNENIAKSNSAVPVSDIKGGYKQEEILRLADTEQIRTPERRRHKYKNKSLAAADKRRDELTQIMLARGSASGWSDTPNYSDPDRPFMPTDPTDKQRTDYEHSIWGRARFDKTAKSNPRIKEMLERVDRSTALIKAKCGISHDAPLRKKPPLDEHGFSFPRIFVFFDHEVSRARRVCGAELYEKGIDGDDGESSFVAAPPPPAGDPDSWEHEEEFAEELLNAIGRRIVICWADRDVAYMDQLLADYAPTDSKTRLFPLSLATFMGLPVHNHSFPECVDLRGVNMQACKARAPDAQRASAMAELFDTFVNTLTVKGESSESTTVSRGDLLNQALDECLLINDRAECARRMWELVGEKDLPKPSVSICQELVKARGNGTLTQMSSVARLWLDVYLDRKPDKVCIFGHEGFLRPNQAFDCDVALKDIPLWVKRNMNKTDQAALDELRSSFPHFASLIDAVAPYSCIGLPPRPAMAYGEPGTGKSAFFAALAKVLGVPCMRIDAGTISAGFLLSGSSTSWDKSSTGEFWNILTRCGSASPLIFIDEIDDRRFPVIPALLAALEPSTAGCFTDEHAGLGVDLSRVIWMAAANDLDAVPPPLLSRFAVIKINAPCGEQARAVCLSVTRDRVEWFHEESGVKMEFSDEAVRTLSSMVPRDMRKEAERALAIALNRGSSVVEIQDINKPPVEEKRRIGFAA